MCVSLPKHENTFYGKTFPPPPQVLSFQTPGAAYLLVFKSDFFYRPGDKRHKTQKSKFEIFCPEIAHGMPIHMVCFFLLESFIFFEKKKPNRHYLSLSKMGQNSNATWVYKNA